MTHELHHKPFVFRDFTEAPAAPSTQTQQPEQTEAAPPPPEPEKPKAAPLPEARFTEQELLAAQREAEQLGRMKGEMDAKREWDTLAQQREEQLIAALQGLLERFDAEAEAQEKQRSHQRSDMSGIVLMIARKLVGKSLDSQPLGAVEPMVNECLTMLAGEAKLAIRVHDDLVGPLKECLSKLHREGQQIEVLADSQMQVGDCSIRWPGGKAERSQEELWAEVEDIVNRAFANVVNKD